MWFRWSRYWLRRKIGRVWIHLSTSFFFLECKEIRAQLAAFGASIVGDSMYVLAAIAEMISPGLNPFGKYKKQCTSEYDKAMAMQEWISYGSG
ncbi:unnamed protein product [Camellia sinensis]